MRYSQSIFRLFLGVADIIVGLIVLPTAVNTILKIFRSPLHLQDPLNIIGQKRFLVTNTNYIYKNATVTINMLETNEVAINRIFPSAFKNTIGLFATVSITVSVYLLIASGIDRLLALSKPLRYNQDFAKRFAISSSLICWFLAILLSILPIFVSGSFYTIIGFSFIGIFGDTSFIFHFVQIGVPLFATWIISFSTYLVSRKILSKERCPTTDENNLKQQHKLSFILTLMVVMFSFSILPIGLALLLLSIIPGANPRFLRTYNSTNNNIAYSLVSTGIIILPSNSIWNFLIYSLRTNKFRKLALEKYKKIWNILNFTKLLSTFQRKREL